MSDEQTGAPKTKPVMLCVPVALLFWWVVPIAYAIVFGSAGWVSWPFAIAVAAGFPVVAGLAYFVTRRTVLIPLIAVVGTVLLVAAPLGWPPWRSPPREVASKAGCPNKLKQLGLALHCYHDVYGCFPPAVITDETGRPMHSWRVLIWPYAEQGLLYEQYRFDEPWNGPNNAKLGEAGFADFVCPNRRRSEDMSTSYVAVIGPDTAWRVNESISFDDITDRHTATILLVEIVNSGIQPMEPRDLHVLQMAPGINPESGQGISSLHAYGTNVLFADGTVRTLPNDTPPEKIQAMLTIGGGEEVELRD